MAASVQPSAAAAAASPEPAADGSMSDDGTEDTLVMRSQLLEKLRTAQAKCADNAAKQKSAMVWLKKKELEVEQAKAKGDDLRKEEEGLKKEEAECQAKLKEYEQFMDKMKAFVANTRKHDKDDGDAGAGGPAGKRPKRECP